jgi:Ca2+/H+ antiporter
MVVCACVRARAHARLCTLLLIVCVCMYVCMYVLCMYVMLDTQDSIYSTPIFFFTDNIHFTDICFNTQ